jgi:hypothetical protein
LEPVGENDVHFGQSNCFDLLCADLHDTAKDRRERFYRRYDLVFSRCCLDGRGVDQLSEYADETTCCGGIVSPITKSTVGGIDVGDFGDSNRSRLVDIGHFDSGYHGVWAFSHSGRRENVFEPVRGVISAVYGTGAAIPVDLLKRNSG